MELCITNFGANISRKKENFEIESEENNIILAADKVSSIIFETEGNISIGALKLALEKNIPVTISDIHGNIVGQLNKINDTSSGEIRKSQYKFFTCEKGIQLGKDWIIEKMNAQKTHLESLLKKRKKDLKPIFIILSYIKKLQNITDYSEENKNQIRGFEGIASKIYYSEISSLLPEKWQFKTREHKNAKEPYNLVLNYLYGILYRKVSYLIVKEGFDPAIGIIHSEGKNKLPFLYDLIEKYRYIGFEVAFEIFNKELVKKEHFINGTLNTECKKIICETLKNKLRELKYYNGKRFTMEKIMEFDMKNIKKTIMEG